MRRTLLAALPTAAVLCVFAIPLAAHATGIPYFGPIVPTLAQTCAAGWGSLAQLVNNAIAFIITLLVLFVAPFMIAWAGFLLVVSPGDPSLRTKAKSILLNTAIGIALALAAWLIVNALLTALTSKGVADWTNKMFSTTADPCLKIELKNLNQAAGQTVNYGTRLSGAQACAGHQGIHSSYSAPENVGGLDPSATTVLCEDGTTQSLTLAPGAKLTPSQVCADNGGIGSSGTDPELQGGDTNTITCADGTTKTLSTSLDIPLSSLGGNGCDPSLVSQAARDGGYSLTNAQANTLACISRGEDQCGNGPVTNYNWNKGSSAAGAYQVLLQDHSSCWDNTVCQQAVDMTGPLNCKSGFSGGNPIPGSTVVQTCLQAAANVRCSAAAAACLVKKNPTFSDWAPYSASNRSCVNQYNI